MHHALGLQIARELMMLADRDSKEVMQEKSFTQAVRRTIPTKCFKILVQQPKLLNGELGFVISKVEVDKTTEDLCFSLVLKFTTWRPSIDIVWKQIIKTWGFLEMPMINFMDNYHVLLHLANERDYVHAWAQEGRVVAGCQF